jgi:hypothetical protein
MSVALKVRQKMGTPLRADHNTLQHNYTNHHHRYLPFPTQMDSKHHQNKVNPIPLPQALQQLSLLLPLISNNWLMMMMIKVEPHSSQVDKSLLTQKLRKSHQLLTQT